MILSMQVSTRVHPCISCHPEECQRGWKVLLSIAHQQVLWCRQVGIINHQPTPFYQLLPAVWYLHVVLQERLCRPKKKVNVDVREADATSSSLFKLFLRRAVDEGNVFVWCFSLLMGHLMACSINVNSIALHSIKRGISDSITFKYDETKMVKTGEFVQEKNCYANPYEPFYCVFTALGCYLSLNAEALKKKEAVHQSRIPV